MTLHLHQHNDIIGLFPVMLIGEKLKLKVDYGFLISSPVHGRKWGSKIYILCIVDNNIIRVLRVLKTFLVLGSEDIHRHVHANIIIHNYDEPTRLDQNWFRGQYDSIATSKIR
jgi:hypothetical protein